MLQVSTKASLRTSVNHLYFVSETYFYTEVTFTSDLDFTSLMSSYSHPFSLISSELPSVLQAKPARAETQCTECLFLLIYNIQKLLHMKNMKRGLTEHCSFGQIQFHVLEYLQHLCPSRVEEVHSKIQRQQNQET